MIVHCSHCDAEVPFDRGMVGRSIACPECGRQFVVPDPDEIEPAPVSFVIHQPRQARNGTVVAFCAVGVLVVLALAAGAVGVSLPGGLGPVGGQTIKVAATDLEAEFGTNPIDAKNRYVGRWLEVSGTVHRVFAKSEGVFSEPHDGLYLNDLHRDKGVRCFASEAALSGLRPGQNVRVIGQLQEIAEKREFGPFKNTVKVLTLTECKIVR